MKQITRTIEKHTIYASTVKIENGEIVKNDLPAVQVENCSMNEEKALKLVIKTYGKQHQYVIRNIDTESVTYGLDYDKFMEMATVVEK